MNHFCCRVSFALIFVVSCSSAIQAEDIEECLDAEERLAYFVEPIRPPVIKEGGEQFVSKAEAIQAIALFLEARAKAELRAWVIDDILTKLCSSDGKNRFFPETCRLKLNTSGSYAQISSNYDSLVSALRNDFSGFPACGISLSMRSTIPYFFQSIYEQKKRGQNLDWLFYSLASKPAFYQSCKLKGTKLNHACSLVLPVLLYASVMEIEIEIKEENKEEIIEKFEETRKKYFDKLDEDVRNLVSFIDEETGIKIINFLSLLQHDLTYIKASLEKIEDSDSRAEAVEIFNIENERLVHRLLVVSQWLSIKEEHASISLKKNMALLNSLMTLQNMVEANEYSEAIVEISELIGCLTGEQNCTRYSEVKSEGATEIKSELESFVKISGFIATLAEAKDGEDIEKRLETLTSPIGSWRRRHEGSLVSLNAFFGASYGESTYSSPEFGEVTNNEAAVFAPIGLQVTKNFGSTAFGVFLSVVDFGHIANSPETLDVNNGTLKSDVESDFDKIFSPGVYVTASTKHAPITLGVGYSEGPYGYRTFVDVNGEESSVDRDRVLQVFLAVDLVLLPF